MNKPLPEFSTIKPENVQADIEQQIEQNKQLIDALLKATNDYNWSNLIYPLSASDNELQRLWSPTSHMNSVVNTPEYVMPIMLVCRCLVSTRQT